MIGIDPVPMLRFPFILPGRLMRPRRGAAWLGLLALLVHALLVGGHKPAGVLAALTADEVACTDLSGAGGIGHDEDADQKLPGHPGARCPFCTLVQGGQLLPPSPCLIFPPAAAWVVIPTPPAPPIPPSVLTASHRPRGPPFES